jgi:hypothetical protein
MLFISHGNHDDSFVEVLIHICMVFAYDMLCDYRNVEFNKYRERCCNSQKPSRSDSANEYERLRAFRLFDFFSIYFLFVCVIFFRRIFQYYPLYFLQLIFLNSKID